MARVPYLRREDAAPGADAVWQRVEAERKLPTGNIFRALAHAPALLDAFLSYANALRDESELDPRLRELAILAVGYATGSEYEIAHHQSHATKAGVTPRQLAEIADFENSDAFGPAELAVMRLARESTLQVDVSEQRWGEASAHLGPPLVGDVSLQRGLPGQSHDGKLGGAERVRVLKVRDLG